MILTDMIVSGATGASAGARGGGAGEGLGAAAAAAEGAPGRALQGQGRAQLQRQGQSINTALRRKRNSVSGAISKAIIQHSTESLLRPTLANDS